MMGNTEKTRERLTKFTETANSILGEEVFTISYVSYIPSIMQPGYLKGNGFLQAFYELCKQLYMNSQNSYDISNLMMTFVNIHPEAFKNIIAKSRPDCEIHYFNIASAIVPKNYTMQKKWHEGCGYKSVECAKFTINCFYAFTRNPNLKSTLFLM